MSTAEDAKKTAGQTADQTKQFGEEKTGQAQQNAQGLGNTAQKKAGEAQQGTADAAQTAQTKAGEAKDGAGNAMQQVLALATLHAVHVLLCVHVTRWSCSRSDALPAPRRSCLQL